MDGLPPTLAQGTWRWLRQGGFPSSPLFQAHGNSIRVTFTNERVDDGKGWVSKALWEGGSGPGEPPEVPKPGPGQAHTSSAGRAGMLILARVK